MQKFIKNTTKKKLVIPNVVLELSGFEKGGTVEICALPEAVVVLKREMTAMELIRAVDSLQRLAVELNRHLETRYPGLYCIGDGSGVTHSLSHASASGVYVAERILETMGGALQV